MSPKFAFMVFTATNIILHVSVFITGLNTCCRAFGRGAVTICFYDLASCDRGSNQDLPHTRRTFYTYATAAVYFDLILLLKKKPTKKPKTKTKLYVEHTLCFLTIRIKMCKLCLNPNILNIVSYSKEYKELYNYKN